MYRKLILLMMICLLTSCASSRRLGRFFAEKSQSSEKKADRTNMFPLFYNSGESTSVLWPLIDSDEHGFSLRPLYNQEDDEYAILFPLIAWNPVVGDGWAGPIVWNDDYSAMFPFFYKDEDDFQFLTYYSFTNNSGFFPLLNVSDDSAWVCGLYQWSESEKSKTHKALFGLLAYWDDENNGDYNHYIFPWYSRKDHDSSFSMMFPLYYAGEEDDGDSYNMLLPFYYYGKNEDGESSFHSLLGGYSKDKNEVDMNITPLWWSGSDSTGEYQLLFPLYYSSEDSTSQHTYLFPWYSDSDKNGERQVLFPLYFGESREDYSMRVTPLSFYKKDKGKSNLCLFPLFSSCSDEEKGTSSWQSPPLLPLASNETKANYSRTSSLFGALYNDVEEGNDSHGSVLGILAGWEDKGGTSRFRIPAIFNMTGLIDMSESKESSKVNFLLYSHEKKPDYIRRDIFPFMTWDSGKEDSGFSFLWRVFETHNRGGKKGGHFLFIPWGEQV